MAYVLEKEVLRQFIMLYRDLPCLWNPSHAEYLNKVSRKQAYDLLVKKYKPLDNLADNYKVRRKIVNIRTAYQRERQKVLKSQNQDGQSHVPTLWYYNLMSFLDELEPGNKYNATSVQTVETTKNNNENDDDENDDEELSVSPPPKRSRKAIRIKSSSSTENDNRYQEPSTNEPSNVLYLGSTSDSDLYGKTISSQLNELRPKQRFIAEKLISDVIFYGRLNKLKIRSKLNNIIDDDNDND